MSTADKKATDLEKQEADAQTGTESEEQTAPQTRRERRRANKAIKLTNPSWFVPLMLTFFVVGLIWIVVFYLTQTRYPIPDIGSWNLVIGFSILMLGFVMTTRWK